MPPKRPRQRIEIDTLFAPLPQDLILDTSVSAPACRLWGLLYVFRWQGLPPDFDRLALALAATERSIYRWLQELESTGWIDWDRNASLADRFTLRTSPHGKEIDSSVKTGSSELILGSKEVTPGSNKLIPRSKELILRSEELTQVSILSFVDGTPMPQSTTLPSDQNHEKTQKNQNGGGGGAPTQAFVQALEERGLHPPTIEKIVHGGYDPTTILQSLDNMLADGAEQGIDPDRMRGRFVTRLRLSPPQKGHPYERQRPVQPKSSANYHRRSGTGARDPERDDDFARLAADAAARARNELL